jgi:N-methylhydantoinase B
MTHQTATSSLRDPITFEVVKNAFIALADELAITVVRTAHSQVVRDSMDFSTAICDARGRVVAQGLGIPLHLGAIPDAMTALLERFGDDIGPGDVFAFNDPDEGGMHLPDIFVIKPVFAGEDLVGYAACVAHHADIGGRVPGGNAVDSIEIFQEGLQIPVLKLYERGRVNETLMTLLLRNVRIPAVVRGDLDAQLAACHTGEAGLLDLVSRYTAAGVSALADEILDYTEGIVRAEIARFPDGEYTFEDHIDDDGFGSGPIPIRVALTINGDELTVDFTGTAPQVRSALNATPSFAKSAVYAALKCALPSDIPSNAGFQRPVAISIPEGSILAPRRPAARAARGLTGFRTVDAVLGALAQAVPARVAAAGEGGATMIAMGGTNADGDAFVFVDFMCGGWGARPDRDGIDGVSALAANLANVPVEEIELDQPVRVRRYGFLPDTGGPGRWRGCLSVVRELEFREERGVLQVRSDRRRFLPYGLAGGRDGTASSNVLDPDGEHRILPTNTTCDIRQGEVFRHTTAGGGGHGDPAHRAVEDVFADVLDEKLTPEYALREYGVAVDLASSTAERVR